VPACKNSGPSTPYDMAFTATPTPVAQITGPLNVVVQDNSQAVTGLQVLAIPPSGSVTYSQMTGIDGHAQFNPPSLEVGNWSIVVPAQTPRPYAQSSASLLVSSPNQAVTFIASQPTVGITPTGNTSYTSTNGGIVQYDLRYDQPGNLLVPVKLKFSTMTANWTAASSPGTIGFTGSSNASLTVVGVSCVDLSPSFAVTLLDLMPTPTIRGFSSPQTITKAFSSGVTVRWTQGYFSNASYCNIWKVSGDGKLIVTSNNSCAVVYVSMTEPRTDCYNGSWETPNGNTSAANAGGGEIAFGPGTYNCTIRSDGGFGTLRARCSSNGATGSVQTTNGTQTVLVTNY